MKVVLHDRTSDGLGQEVRDTAERKLTRLARRFDKVAEAEVEFAEERKRSGLAITVCRIKMNLVGRRTPVIYARERGADPTSALDLALDKIDRQVVSFKEKVTHRKQAVSPVRVPRALETSPPRSYQPEHLRLKLRPMSEAEAISELQADGQPVVVYLDEDSGEIQILLRRSDGTLAVIEPVVP